MKSYKKLLSKIAIILLISLTCCFFTACKVESVAEHDKRVAKEAEELEKQVKETSKNATDTTENTDATTEAGGESTDGSAESAGASDAGGSGSTNSGGSSGDSGAVVDNGGSSQVPDTPVAAVVTINVKTREDGYLVSGATVVVEDGATVFDAMLQAQRNGILTMDYESDMTYGKYVIGINGKYRVKGTEAGWKYTMSSKANPLSISDEYVHDGEVLTWFYVQKATETVY